MLSVLAQLVLAVDVFTLLDQLCTLVLLVLLLRHWDGTFTRMCGLCLKWDCFCCCLCFVPMSVSGVEGQIVLHMHAKSGDGSSTQTET